MTATTSNTGMPYVYDVNLAAHQSTGTYTTPTITVGTNISSWGPLTITDQNNGNNVYYFFNSSNTTTMNESCWTAVTNGSIPTNNPYAYAVLKASYTLDASTDDAHCLSEITVNWTEGSPIRASSSYSKQRYWLGISISSTGNNKVLVYDRMGQWQRYSIPATAMVMHNANIYFGNTQGTFLAESGYNDNGTAIVSYYKTPTFASSGLDLYSKLNYLYMTTDFSDSTLSTDFYVDDAATDYGMGDYVMNTKLGIQNFKLPFSTGQITQGKYVSFKWTTNGTSFWRILNGNLYFDRGLIPTD
jgi:hypothetical protein